jgi:hypothetical protein
MGKAVKMKIAIIAKTATIFTPFCAVFSQSSKFFSQLNDEDGENGDDTPSLIVKTND